MAEKADSFGKLGTVDRDRVFGLSDGIIAFAMTLLVLQIAIPDPSATKSAELPFAVAALWPKVLVYIFSFVVIGYYWTIHHQIIRHISRFDKPTLWMNIAFLLCVGLMPFPAALMGEYEDQPISATVFAADLGLSGLFLSMIGYHAFRRGAFYGAVQGRSERYFMVRGTVPALAFIVSIPLAHLNVGLAVLAWCSIPLLILCGERAFCGKGQVSPA